MSLSIRGGAGGLAADLAAMRSAAEVLAAVGADVAVVGVRVCSLSLDGDLVLASPLDPTGFARSQRRLLPLVGGPRGVVACAGRVTVLAGRVASAAALYATAEQTASAIAGQLVAGAALLAGAGTGVVLRAVGPQLIAGAGVAVSTWVSWRAAPLLWDEARLVVVDAGSGQLRLDSLDERFIRYVAGGVLVLRRDADAVSGRALGWFAQHPDLTQTLVGGAPGFLDGLTGPLVVPGSLTPGGLADPLWPPDDVGELAAALSALGYWAPLLVAGDVTVTLVDGENDPPPAVPASPGVVGALQRLALYSTPLQPGNPVPRTTWRERTAKLGYEPNRIRVERIERSGQVRWAVYIPPTQTWSVIGGRNPFDGSTNIRSVGGRQTAAAAAVTEALKQSCVRPGEPVMLSGYSQGGLTAAQLAGSEEFRGQFDVDAVLTVGSPVAGFDIRDDVAVLSLEHEHDLVPALDGMPNRDVPHWLTVRRDLVADIGPGVADDLLRDPTTAHRIEYYLDSGALVDSSPDESVLAWQEAAAPFLDTAGADVTVAEYVAERDGP